MLSKRSVACRFITLVTAKIVFSVEIFSVYYHEPVSVTGRSSSRISTCTLCYPHPQSRTWFIRERKSLDVRRDAGHDFMHTHRVVDGSLGIFSGSYVLH